MPVLPRGGRRLNCRSTFATRIHRTADQGLPWWCHLFNTDWKSKSISPQAFASRFLSTKKRVYTMSLAFQVCIFLRFIFSNMTLFTEPVNANQITLMTRLVLTFYTLVLILCSYQQHVLKSLRSTPQTLYFEFIYSCIASIKLYIWFWIFFLQLAVVPYCSLGNSEWINMSPL